MSDGRRYAEPAARVAPTLRTGRHARRRHLATDTAWSALIQFLRLCASLGTFIAFRNTIGISQYGRFAGVQGLVVLSTLLGCFWLPQLVLQRVLRDGLTVEEMTARAVSLAAVGSAVSFAVIMVSGRVFLPAVPRGAIAALGLSEIVAATLVETPASLFQTRQGFAAAAPIRLITPLCRLAAVIITIVMSVHSLSMFAVLVLATLLPSALVGAGITLRRLRIRPRFGPFLRTDLVAGLSYSSIGGLYVVQDDGDKTMLVSAGFTADASSYAAAYRVFQIALFPVNAFVTATHARFLQFHESEPAKARRRRALRFATPTFLYGVAAAAFVFVAAAPLATLMGIKGQAVIFRWLCLLLPLRCTAEFALNGLLGLGKNWLRVAIVAFSGFTNVAINLIFIPSHSWRAAAVATLIADALLTATAWVTLVVLTRSHRAAPAAAAPTDAGPTAGTSPAAVAGTSARRPRLWGVRPRHSRR